MMSKKHFELIAEVLSNQNKVDIQLVNQLMDIFEMINPRFNRNIFLKKVVNNKKIYVSEDEKVLQDKNIKWSSPSIIKSYESN